MWFALALTLFTGSAAWFCWLQSPNPDANAKYEILSWKSWWYPLEINALKRLPSVPAVTLKDVFVTNNIGWAVGTQGVILHTRDGGRNWVLQTNIDWTIIYKNSISELLEGKRLSEGEDLVGLIEDEFQQKASARGNVAIAVKELNIANQSTPAVNDAESIRKLNDIIENQDQAGGSLSLPTAAKLPRGPAPLHEIFFVDEQTGWAVGRDAILKTEDGGASWKQQLRSDVNYLWTLTFGDKKRGYAAGANALLQTDSGGESWKDVYRAMRPFSQILIRGNFFALQWISEDDVLVLTDQRLKRLTSTNFADAVTNELNCRSLSMVSASEGWATSRGGDIFKIKIPEQSALLQTNFEGAFLMDIHSADGKRCVAVGDEGVILSTEDGGEHWKDQRFPTGHHLNAIHFSDPSRAWAVGEDGLIIHSQDGGSTWIAQTRTSTVSDAPYQRFPAPLFYVVLLGCVGLVYSGSRLPDSSSVEEKKDASIADYAVSDRPLTLKDFDALNFGILAEGIARFLRNKSTHGPLTLAVTGRWGSGKSSIMGLMKEKLQAMGIRPVWFNAWHHEQEEQLLAGLLESIREQAIPSWFSYEGIYFRWNLFTRRMRRVWPSTMVCVAVIAILTAVISHFGIQLEDWFTDLSKTPLPLMAGKIAVVITAAVTLFRGAHSLKAFGVEPAQLLSSLVDRAKIRDLKAQTSFRHRFAQEFEDVTEALHPLNMTIFIDDLDRCSPQQVMQVMQSLNFLASSGNCFLVIGMDESVVTNSVAISLKDQFDFREGKKLTEDVKLDAQWKHAKLWMEKLIQIWVPVPDPDDEQFKALLLGKQDAEKKSTKRSRWWEIPPEGWAVTKPALPWIGVIICAFAGYICTKTFLESQPAPVKSNATDNVKWSENSIIQPDAIQSVRLQVPEPTTGAALIANSNLEQWVKTQKWTVQMEFEPNIVEPAEPKTTPDPGSERSKAEQSLDTVAQEEIVPLTTEAPQTDYSLWWLPLGILPFLCGFVLKKIMKVLNQEYEDSKVFRSALARWSPWIHGNSESRKTPRAAKRMVNKIRFYAMMSRALLQAKTGSIIPENVIVAFGALENSIIDGRILPSAELFEALRNEKPPEPKVGSLNEDFDQLKAALQQNPALFRYLSSSLATEAKPRAKA